MKRLLLFIVCANLFYGYVHAQATNFLCTNAVAEQVMLGNYNPALFTSPLPITHPDSVAKDILKQVNADTLKKNILKLASFHNRNTGSDTVSNTHGYGAARRWVFSQFQQYSVVHNNRLLPAYLQFDQLICTIGKHSDVIAVLPGTDTTDKSILLVEAHMDSRCEDLCDTTCLAEGVEDNASGTALVMELARVMCKYSFNHTIVFMITTSEEQGLYGAEAFADYVQSKNIKIRAVQNNDVIGGIACGNTASQPGCMSLNAIDSTQVRLFSAGSFNSAHKQYSRFVKLEYREQLLPLAPPVPMTISIMTPEDRTGRGGDHIPFRQHGYTAMRFTAANEHGNANVTDTTYTDRQHSYRDTLGIDLNADGTVDSFFVDFRYLARNTTINANALAMAAMGPRTPDLNVIAVGNDLIEVHITNQTNYSHYRFADRSVTNDWDSVYMMNDTVATIHVQPAAIHYVSVASVDALGVESLFSREVLLHVATNVNNIESTKPGITLLPNKPNPFDEATMLSVEVNETMKSQTAVIRITDVKGSVVKELPITLNQGVNEVLYEHAINLSGTFIYSLVIDGVVMQSMQMVFAN